MHEEFPVLVSALKNRKAEARRRLRRFDGFGLDCPAQPNLLLVCSSHLVA